MIIIILLLLLLLLIIIIIIIQFVAHDIEEKLYCDNVLTGTDDEDSAVKYYISSRQIMKDADMNFRQWFTNSVALTSVINQAPVVQTMDSAIQGINHYPRG